jgi:hypothetical protein
MNLLPKYLKDRLPPLYSQEKEEDPIVFAHFFTPDSSWEWYITEGEQEEDDYIFFGLTVGDFQEWGYISLKELESVKGPWGLPIERDRYFPECHISDVTEGLTRAG